VYLVLILCCFVQVVVVPWIHMGCKQKKKKLYRERERRGPGGYTPLSLLVVVFQTRVGYETLAFDV